jgi:hypothetical protein
VAFWESALRKLFSAFEAADSITSLYTLAFNGDPFTSLVSR